ncbi:DNA-binding response regulator [Laspinema sp. A4]|uniref:DNA-binding response regulator n=1 Tax=Laspinema sp. D2d TaxID=2953686 RepID=UPI0021BB6CD5|nr:DNA-binding response regulator [Laspinema sp. D2d]MCT7983410.1 DNA-binding response regulator [Laspinema sp. D2d]
MDSEQTQEILSLRERKLTPKQIARKMGLKVSDVTGFLKEQAEQVAIAREESGELPPLVECLVNTNCLHRLFPPEDELNPASDEDEDDEIHNKRGPGFAIVTVTRSPGFNRYITCNYLVDYWCLGVKDASGPRKYNRSEYERIINLYYDSLIGGSERISLTEAQAIVWGAVEYAEKLGFKPHADFEKAKKYLGEWDREVEIEFGDNGKPLYHSGPYDNPTSIINTLNKSVGEGNYHYIVGLNPDNEEFSDFI